MARCRCAVRARPQVRAIAHNWEVVMNRWLFVRVCALSALVLALLPIGLAGQSAVGTKPSSTGWTPARTPDGQPDIQGTWVNFDSTPLEAPGEDDAARLAALAVWFPGVDAPRGKRNILGPNPSPEFNDTAAKRTASRRSLVVDPPDGRVPVRAEAEKQRNYNLIHLTDSWEYHTPWERCITRGVPGGMFPAGYNNGYSILQAPGYVAILYEMIHRWEGNTLVVEVTNYSRQTVGTVATGIATTATLKGVPQSEAMRVVERFTRVDAVTLQYEATIEDPDIYTRPWTVAMPLNKADDYRIYEYACHEGNYGLPNSLSGSRAEERAAAKAK
jgi:hypothetical protein